MGDSREVLRATVPDVLDEVAFLLVAPMEAPVAWEGQVLESSIRFGGARDGALRVRMPAELVFELAGNMLGLMDLDPDDLAPARDALGELANMLIGVVLAAWRGPGERHEIGLPKTCVLSTVELDAVAPGAVQSFVTDDGLRIDVGLHVEEKG